MVSDLRIVSARLQVELTAFKGLKFRFLVLVWFASFSSVAPFSYYTPAQHPQVGQLLGVSTQVLFKILMLFCFSCNG